MGCSYPWFKGEINVYAVESNSHEMISDVIQLVTKITFLMANKILICIDTLTNSILLATL